MLYSGVLLCWEWGINHNLRKPKCSSLSMKDVMVNYSTHHYETFTGWLIAQELRNRLLNGGYDMMWINSLTRCCMVVAAIYIGVPVWAEVPTACRDGCLFVENIGLFSASDLYLLFKIEEDWIILKLLLRNDSTPAKLAWIDGVYIIYSYKSLR